MPENYTLNLNPKELQKVDEFRQSCDTVTIEAACFNTNLSIIFSKNELYQAGSIAVL